MPLSLDEVHDHIDSWVISPEVETLHPATDLLASMAVGDPGRVDVLTVIADHQSLRGDTDRALATLDQAAADPGADPDLIEAMRAAYLIAAGSDEAEPLLRELRRRVSRLPEETIERVAGSLESVGLLREAMRWFTLGLGDLDPQRDQPEPEEEYALIGRWRVRQALGLPPDHFDELARVTLELRRRR